MPNGIATTYAGTRFRSRLEARWACTFDQLGWQWEYEPFDHDGWIPDFLIVGGRELLIEVKPCATITELEIVALNTPDDHRDILALGCVAFPHGHPDWKRWPAGALVEHHHDGRYYGAAEWGYCDTCDIVTVHHADHSFDCRPCGHHHGYATTANHTLIADAWANARNSTQWKAPA